MSTNKVLKKKGGGMSVEEEFTNKIMGEKVYRHTLKHTDGRIFEEGHIRKYHKQIGKGD